MKPRIAFIGSRGIPAQYGGFETFTEHVAPSLAARGYEVFVSCEGTALPRPSEYKGVKLFYFPLRPFKRSFYEILYDVYSLIEASLTCDCIVMLGYGAGFFFFIPRLFRKRIAVNVDGREWTREKYNTLEKAALYVNETYALRYADAVIADARAIKAYLKTSRDTDAAFIPYGVDEPRGVEWDPLLFRELHAVGRVDNIASGEYYLIIARLERDNNVHTMIEGFLTADTDKTLIVVGNFLDRRYRKEVEDLVARHQGHDRVTFTGAIYERSAVTMLRQHCFAYLHGHSAGGTNPSLLEAMIARNLIIAHDNPFNREVCDRYAVFFTTAADLRTCVRSVEAHPDEYEALRTGALTRAKNEYAWDKVVHEYEVLIEDTLKCQK